MVVCHLLSSSRSISTVARQKTQNLNGRLPLEQGSNRHETLRKRVSDDSRHFIFRRRKPKKKCRTLNGRLPLEYGSVRPQTLGKRVSDDSRHFIFRRRKKKLAKIFDKNFHQKNFRRKIDKLPFFAELWIFGPNRQMRLEKLPPKF